MPTLLEPSAFTVRQVGGKCRYCIASLIDAYTVYQDIEYALTNVLRKAEAPTVQTDKERILAHGFDVKTSFRGK